MSAGLLDASCPANAAATLTWLATKRPQHWRQLSAALLVPVNNMLHAWSGDRRANLPNALAELILPLLRVSQAVIDTALQSSAAAGTCCSSKPLAAHWQESAAALAGNGSRAAAEQIRQDMQATSDAEVAAALPAGAERAHTPKESILLSAEDRQLCCAALQCQEHILEAGSSPSGMFKGQVALLLGQLASSNEFAAAAVQLLVACCQHWDTARQGQQRREREKQAAQPACEAAAASGSSSSSRECLVPKKQLLASELLVAAAYEEYPANSHCLAVVLEDMLKAQVCGW